MNITDFFLLCSGANKDILNMCPTEKNKFIGIGTTIFFTALLSAISGGYAIFFTFGSILISLIFGLIWGLMIFSLDRYIVLSINKPTIPKEKSERKRVYRKQIWSAFPRILIAIVLSLTISKPLEIKLFDGTINKQLGSNENRYNIQCEENFNSQRSGLLQQDKRLNDEANEQKNSIYLKDPIYKDLNDQKVKLDESIKNNQSVINANNMVIEDNTSKEIIDSKELTRYNGLARGKMSENNSLYGQNRKNEKTLIDINTKLNSRKEELFKQVKTIEENYSKQMVAIQKQIKDLNGRRESIIEKCRQEAASDKDILSRLRALSELKEFGNAVWFASLLITLLFILLETAPITVKLLSNRGPYDEILEKMEEQIILKQKQQIDNFYKNLEQENLEEKFKREMHTTQYDINKHKMEHWKEQEINKLNIKNEEVIKELQSNTTTEPYFILIDCDFIIDHSSFFHRNIIILQNILLQKNYRWFDDYSNNTKPLSKQESYILLEKNSKIMWVKLKSEYQDNQHIEQNIKGSDIINDHLILD